ncbi:hypothetical protein DWB85_11525 [Seongchinamella sediminis]|uniref:Uncharacterized protein n=1 Tax=Seongchinamella sediminis TaxID=2283635 RepID=A0A3L7DVP6_9GAMM|nr:hypothetical protein DWB85_11525 [Seongchinamella sediminis]
MLRATGAAAAGGAGCAGSGVAGSGVAGSGAAGSGRGVGCGGACSLPGAPLNCPAGGAGPAAAMSCTAASEALIFATAAGSLRLPRSHSSQAITAVASTRAVASTIILAGCCLSA